MARPKKWPPSLYSHPTRKVDRVRINGRDYTLGATGSAESRREYLRLVQAAQSGTPAPPKLAPFTVNDLAAWWAEYAARAFGPASDEPRHGARVLEVACQAIGGCLAAEMSPKRLRTVQSLMLSKWSRSNTNRQIVRLKTVIKRACDDEIIPPEVYQRIACVGAVRKGSPGAREGSKRAAATREALDRVIPEVPAEVGAMLELMWWTGARPGEVRILRTGDLERSNTPWIFRPESHKKAWRGNDRVIPLGPKAMAVLEPWIRPFEPGAYCFRTLRGKPWRTDRIAQEVLEACGRARVKFTPYQLRHAFKRRAIAAGGISAAMAALGQTSSEAFDRYDHGGDFGEAVELARNIG